MHRFYYFYATQVCCFAANLSLSGKLLLNRKINYNGPLKKQNLAESPFKPPDNEDAESNIFGAESYRIANFFCFLIYKEWGGF